MKVDPKGKSVRTSKVTLSLLFGVAPPVPSIKIWPIPSWDSLELPTGVEHKWRNHPNLTGWTF